MSTISPSPNSTPSTAPPPTPSSAPPPSPPPGPPPQSNPTAPAVSPPPSQSNSTPPAESPPPSQSAPPAESPPPSQSPPATEPPSQSNSTQPPSQSPPPNATSPPPVEQPSMATPPPTVSSPPQSPASPPSSPPTSSAPPPSIPPTSSPPPPPNSSIPPNPPPTRSPPPPTSSPLPPSSNPPASSPPPSAPPRSSPPPSSTPPEISTPPPSTQPPINSPPPPKSKPPESSPPTPVSQPPSQSPPPPSGEPPSNPPPPPVLAPPSNSSPNPVLNPPSSPPSEKLSPPLRSPVSPGAPTTNSSNSDAGSTGGKGIGSTGIVAIGVVVGLILLSVIGAAAWCVWKRKKKDSGPNGGHILPTSVGSSSPKSDSGLLRVGKSSANTAISSRNDFVYSPVEPGGLGSSRSLFTFDELMAATDGFSAHNLLGEGGFGSVYKGHLLDGREVAVKQLKIGGSQGEREFRAEVETISRIHHRHLVSLVGYCISDNRRLLIYDYLPNNTLYFHLHGQGRPVMDWAMRVRIAVGGARGLAYLHEDCHPRIIHRDIKSSNILLDSNFQARVSDFGLAKICQDSNTHISTRVMGTFGYMAPEYASSGKLTDKSDVFSFGVVLMELITGRKPVDSSQPLGEESLVEWGRPLLNHAMETEQFDELVDPRLEKNYVDSEMLLLIEVAAACVRHSSAKRPQMGQVVRAFDSLATYDLTNGMRVGESEIFNSAQQSEEIRWFRRMAFGNQDYSTDFFSQGSYS